ncbi:FAD-dependent monooxygenase [Rhodovulum sp. DZ06]|uniref:FAD-dependent monooxygenase n=1 Tax=Rhodovulum sp. DZ06 TaxID=3425126 RepID=UPI003D34C92C
MNAQAKDADVIIVGGGLNGPAAALALAQGGLRVLVLDAAPTETRADPEFDGRAYNIALAGKRMFEALDLWPAVADQAQPVWDIVVTDGRRGESPSPLFLHFDHRELDEGAGGWMIEDRHLRPALIAAMEASPLITQRAPVRVVSHSGTGHAAEVVLEDGEVLRASVIVACDGRDSPIARREGIRRVGWSYGQTGLVCAVAHEKPHNGVAYEHFLPAGPFAILPLTGNRSSLVWTETDAEAKRIAGLGDDAYLAEVAERFGDFLGGLTLEGKRWAYPLKLSLAQDWVAPRAALLGDAAHAVHPIAGQGLNLGLRDAAALAEVLVDAKRAGEDIGTDLVLRRYESARRFDATALALAMDGLNRLFSNDLPLLRPLRDAGLALAGAFAPARRMFMREAAGLSAHAPRLMEGRRL